MARKKTSRRATRKKNKEHPGWVWATAGLSVGLLVAAFIWIAGLERPFRMEESERSSENSSATKTEQGVANPKSARKQTSKPLEPVIEPPPVENKYEFYNMLKNQTIDAPTSQYRGKDKIQPLLQTEQSKKTNAKSGSHILQAGSFRKLNDARKRKGELAILGIESRIEKVMVNDGYWHRIRIGPFKLDKANNLRTRLLSENIQTILIPAGK